jgi:predicted glycosyltransferase involved in capsule biosynthesis
MFNLNSSVIVFYRKDSEDRERNLKILIEYYQKHFENYQLVICEQPYKETSFSLKDYENVHHEVIEPINDTWNKMKAYNEGVKNAFYENLIFNDIDVIFSPHCLLESLSLLQKDTKKIILPNDGHFVCVKKAAILKFKDNLEYDSLIDLIDSDHYNQIGYHNDNTHIGHTQTPGGGFITKKRNIFNCNGFNPNFLGWGYEDNETLVRFNKMGYTVCRLNVNQGQKRPLFHLDHEDAEREHNPYYKINNNICNFVEKIDSKLLYLYSNTWVM